MDRLFQGARDADRGFQQRPAVHQPSPKHIGKLPPLVPLWGTSLEILCRGFGVELRWMQFGRGGGYIGETDEELARRARRLFRWP